MRKVLYIIMCTLVLTACGNRRKACNAVEDFLRQNLVNAEFKTEYISMDSTYKVKDSVLIALQQQAPQDKAFKKGIKWDKPVPGKIIYMRMKVIQQEDTIVRTFYLDPEMTKVLAFKQN